jgi:hypothetical protein
MTPEKLLDLIEDLASQYPVTVSTQRVLGLIASVVTNNLTDNQIILAANRCRDELRFFPLPVEFLDRAIEKVEDDDANAHRAFDALRLNSGCKLGHVDPVFGTQWDRKKVQESLGEAAAMAFDAIGGNAAFKAMSERSETFDRSAFLKAYRTASVATQRRKQLAGSPNLIDGATK